MFIGTWTLGQDALFLQNQFGATDIVMGANKLANLAVGNSTFYMDRTHAQDVVDAPQAGGRICSKFRAKNKVVYVEP